MEGLRAALSLAAEARGLQPWLDTTAEQQRADALFLSAVTPTLLCALQRRRQGLAARASRPGARRRGQLPLDAHGRGSASRARPGRRAVPHPHDRPRLQRLDVHRPRRRLDRRRLRGLRASAALGALSGPLHGGAPSRALALLDEIGELAR